VSGLDAVQLALGDAQFLGSTLIKQAIVITGTSAGTFRGDLLLRDGYIVDVAPELDAGDAEVVDASGYIVCAGFIDAHRHLWHALFKGFVYDIGLMDVFANLYGVYCWRFIPDDIYAATLLGRLTALDAGVTTVLDWAHNHATPDMEDAAIQALHDAGGRSVFGYGFGADRLSPASLERYHAQPRAFSSAERIRKSLPDDDALLSSCYLGLEPGYVISMEACKKEFAIARELGMRISVHINSLGSESTVFASIEAMHAEGLLSEDTTYVHLTGTTDHGLKLIADTGGTTSLSPQVEAHMPSMTPPPTGRLLAAGLRPSLSLDGAASGSEDFFSQMRSTFDVERALTKTGAHPSTDTQLTLKDVFEFATVQGARALGQQHRLGSIAAGKAADLLFINTTSPNMMPVLDPLAAVVFHASIGDIDTVLVHGTPVKRDGRLVADLAKVSHRIEEAVDRLYWQADLPPTAVRPHPAVRPHNCR
jgi:5-methylthioadenosine/S-adenosylhomocysteine deaminase